MIKSVFGTEELWSVLKESSSPILLYGTGDGADKILSVMERKGIKASGFFASDGFVRDRYFHGAHVMSFSEAEEKYGDFTVLVAFGSSRPEVIENVKHIASRHRLFIPDVPVCGENLFDADFYLSNLDRIGEARKLLCDGRSVDVYDDIIKFKLSGKPEYLYFSECPEEETFSLLSGGYGAYVDLGAYTGDTVKKALSLCPSIKKVCAFEPANKPFEKLSQYCASVPCVDFNLVRACAWDKTESLEISDGGGRGSHISSSTSLSGAKTKTVVCTSPDNACNFYGEKLLIKYDVEGAEEKALCGSASLIKNNDTELAVSLYHRSEDIFSLILLAHKLMPERKLYLRRLSGFPAWDINLFVSKK